MVYIYEPYFHSTESARTILRIRLKRGNGRLGKYATLGSSNEESWRFRGYKKETWTYTRPARLIAVRGMMLDFFSNKTTQFINTLALDVIQVLDSRNYLYLAKVNKVPCICVAAISFGQRVDG